MDMVVEDWWMDNPYFLCLQEKHPNTWMEQKSEVFPVCVCV